MISQDLFDETVLENQDVFDLTPEQALMETLSQYRDQVDLSHLITTHPQLDLDSRRQRQAFVNALTHLDEECIGTDGSCFCLGVLVTEWLQTIRQCIIDCPKAYLILLQQHEGMYTLMTLLNAKNLVVGHHEETIIMEVIQTLIVILTTTTPTIVSQKNTTTTTTTTILTCRELQAQLRAMMSTTLQTSWMHLYQEACCCHCSTTTTTNDGNNTIRLQSLLLQLAYVACRTNEANKKAWMKGASEFNAVERLLETFGPQQQPEQQQQDEEGVVVGVEQDQEALLMVVQHAAKLITVLCKFDDFATAPSVVGPVVSSVHDHVMEFVKRGAVPILLETVTSMCSSNNNNKKNNNNNTAVLASVLSALRVLAIQDDVIQRMVALGVLDIVEMTLLEPTTTTAREDSSLVAAATLGLIRNLCANDNVKTSLCNDVVLSGMLNAMTTFPQELTVQEHACGTMAAMSLRQPTNAVMIVEKHIGHEYIIRAMRLYPTHILVQRQGALALRNLVSRSNELIHVLLDAGAEQVLRNAGQQQGCVDEAYAALRDLNCSGVKVLTVQENGTIRQGPLMFGESKANFRPTFEPSSK